MHFPTTPEHGAPAFLGLCLLSTAGTKPIPLRVWWAEDSLTDEARDRSRLQFGAVVVSGMGAFATLQALALK